MIEIELAEPPGGRSVPLALRAVKGAPLVGPPMLEERLILGDPAVTRLSPEKVGGDEELRLFVADEAAHAAYWLVQFTCTFEHDESLPFSKAWLRLELASESGKAVAHSMEPARQSVNRTIHWKATLTIPCVLVALGAEGDHVTESVFCEAGAEGTPKPSWKFFRTSGSEIRGLQRLRLVVRTPAAGGLSAVARIGATAAHKTIGGLRDLSYETEPDATAGWIAEPAAASPTPQS